MVWSAKVALTIVLLLYIRRQVDWEHVVRAISTLEPAAGFGAVAAMLLVGVLASLRWWILVRGPGVNLSPMQAVRLVFLGDFLSMVLPGTIGGDVVRAYCACKNTDRKAHIAASILGDRLAGLLGLFLLGSIAGVISWYRARVPTAVLVAPCLALAAVAGAMASAAALIGNPRFPSVLKHLRQRRSRWVRVLLRVLFAVLAYRRRKAALLTALGLTVTGQVLVCGTALLLGSGLGLTAAPLTYCFAVPAVTALSAIPLTPGSIGVAEELYLLLLRGAASPARILALALLMRLAWMASVLPGALALVTGVPALRRVERS